jgi:Ca2+-binding RTX toxin-like protein
LSTQPAGAVRNFATGSLKDVVLSADGKAAYVSTADGAVTAYDLASGASTGVWKLGVNLGGMDVSLDGRYLLAAERDTSGQASGGAKGMLTLHRLDLLTGAIKDFTAPSPGGASAFDVGFTSDGKALIGEGYSVNGTGYSTVIDLSNETYTQQKVNYLWGTTIAVSRDHSTLLVSPELAGGWDYLHVFKSGRGFALNWSDQDYEASRGLISLSSDGKMAVAEMAFYSNSLNSRRNFTTQGDQPSVTGGSVFAPDGKSFYFLDTITKSILEMSTATLTVERVFSAASGVATNNPGGAYGDTLSISADGRYLVIMGQTLQVVDLKIAVADGGTGYADHLIGGAAADAMAGYGDADLLEGGGGSDTLRGGYGDDTLAGGAGDDYLYGGEGVDTADYSGADAAIVLQAPGYGTWMARGEGIDWLSQIENVRGGKFADLIVGTAYANRLEGGDGADTLAGGDSSDTLEGGGGDDVVSGDAGDDSLNGGAGSDIASYGAAKAAVTVDLSITGPQNTQGDGSDSLVSIEGIIGSQFDDTLKGDAQANSLSGGGGADFIDGGDGDDTLAGESGDDVVWGGLGRDYAIGGAGFDQINGNVGNDTAHGGEGGDWVVGGKDEDLLYGDAGDDVVYGNLGDDTCYGGDGADWVRGGQGDDVIDGGNGNDWMAGDRGNDTVTGGAGADKFYFFAGAAIDRVTDFSSAAGDRVLLDVGQAYTVKYSTEGTVIDLGNGDQMILVGVTQASLGDWLVI